MIEPRGWQISALEKFKEHTGLAFLANVTPAAGKTIYSGLVYRWLLEQEVADFSIVVVPTTPLKENFMEEWHKLGIELTTVLKNKQGCPSEWGGGVVTYQQLANLVPTLETWAANGTKIHVTFDELHHLTEDNVWGAAAERLARCSVKILGMTGTMFRGDGNRVSFVNYDSDGYAIADFAYSYRRAVADGVCRAVEFITDDGIAEFIREEEAKTISISDAKTEDDARDVAKTVLSSDAQWLKTFIERADTKLEEYRLQSPQAGGLVVCRPGRDEQDQRYLRQVGKLIHDATSEAPTVISYDDSDADDQIRAFRKASQKWIAAVRKITEGVDIKRLRVLVMAMRPTTLLLFFQLVGRVTRVIDSSKAEYATVFIPKFPQLKQWAENMMEEAKLGLRDREEVKTRKSDNESDSKTVDFISLGSTHVPGGAISDFGDEFTADEINSAERMKKNDRQLFDIPITKVAYLLRKWNVEIEPLEPVNKPLQVQKKELRKDINKLARSLAVRRNEDAPDYKRVWIDLGRYFRFKGIDDLTDNYSIDVMRQCLELLKNWMTKHDQA